MNIAAALFVAALAAPAPYYAPGSWQETYAARAERLATIALAIDDATADAGKWRAGWTRADWAWLVYTKAWSESGRFDLRVHDGRLRGDRGRSVCLGQILGGSPALLGIGYDATRACIGETLRILRLHAERCRVGSASRAAAARIYAGYGTGYSCAPTISWARRRAALWEKWRSQ